MSLRRSLAGYHVDVESPHVGLVGCGHWGQNILRDLKLLGAIVHVVARSPASRARAEQQNADAIVSRIEMMPPVEAVYIATTIGTHAEVIEAVIDRGVPIFCEKPLTDDVGRAEAVAQRAPDRLFVLDKWRYHPGILALAEIARSGELGDVVGLCTRRLGWGNPHPDSDVAWYLAPHDLAIGLEILGTIPPVHAAAVDGKPAAAGSTALISGFVALLSDGRVWHSIELSERSPERVRWARLLCREGGVTLHDPFADHIAIHRLAVGEVGRPCEIERRGISDAWPLKTMLGETLRFLRGGPPPKSTAAEGVMAVRRVQEIRAAAGIERSLART